MEGLHLGTDTATLVVWASPTSGPLLAIIWTWRSWGTPGLSMIRICGFQSSFSSCWTRNGLHYSIEQDVKADLVMLAMFPNAGLGTCELHKDGLPVQ